MWFGHARRVSAMSGAFFQKVEIKWQPTYPKNSIYKRLTQRVSISEEKSGWAANQPGAPSSAALDDRSIVVWGETTHHPARSNQTQLPNIARSVGTTHNYWHGVLPRFGIMHSQCPQYCPWECQRKFWTERKKVATDIPQKTHFRNGDFWVCRLPLFCAPFRILSLVHCLITVIMWSAWFQTLAMHHANSCAEFLLVYIARSAGTTHNYWHGVLRGSGIMHSQCPQYCPWECQREFWTERKKVATDIPQKLHLQKGDAESVNIWGEKWVGSESTWCTLKCSPWR